MGIFMLLVVGLLFILLVSPVLLAIRFAVVSFTTALFSILVSPGLLAIMIFTVVLLGATFFHYNEDGWTYLDAVYWCVVTTTTVGFGDMIQFKCGLYTTTH